MRQVRTLLVDAFTDEPLAGNAAGVVPDAEGLDARQCQAVARELSVSETAFLFPAADADRRVRYFTPTQEVDLCGHATIGTFAGLLADGAIDPGTHALATEVGVLTIEVRDDGTVWMAQDDPEVRRVDADRERIAGALGASPDAIADVADELPIAVASTGLPWLVVPIGYLSQVGDLDPDMPAVEAVADEHGAVGIYAFTFDTLGPDATLHTRAFAPGAGVPEDPVTGTAAGAVGAYLRHVDAFDGDPPDELGIEQGHYLDRPGEVRVEVGDPIRVGGRGAVALDGTLTVPPADEDDIIEA